MVMNSNLLAPASGEDALIRVLFTLLILIVGHLTVKLADLGFRKFWVKGRQLNKKQVRERHEALQYLKYLLDGMVIIAALVYLNAGLTTNITTDFVEFMPDLLSIILLGILGVILINLGIKIGAELLEVLGVKSYFRDIGLSESALSVLSALVKIFLYLLLLQIALDQLGIGETFLDELVTASSWALALLVAALLFYGFKELAQNFAAGIYLKNTRQVRPGEEIRIGDETGEIKNISLFSATVETDTGHTLLTSNSEIMSSDIRFKRTKSDIETLEDMKEYFVAEKESYTGPASMEMALDIFGYREDQERIDENAEELEPEHLIESVEKLTDEEVKGEFIPQDKITNLGDEFKAWFNDGALIVIHFDREELFTEEGGEYALAVGFESNEALVIDPSSKTGGVYFVDRQKLHEAMKNKGYIALAPEGTNAYWRIKNELVYGDKNYYDELSKTLETRLAKILRQGRILKNVMPSSVKNYMENWRSERYVTRIWEPETVEGDKNEASENN